MRDRGREHFPGEQSLPPSTCTVREKKIIHGKSLLIVNERRIYLDQCLELLKFEFDKSDDFGTIQLIFCKQLLYNRKDIIKEI